MNTWSKILLVVVAVLIPLLLVLAVVAICFVTEKVVEQVAFKETILLSPDPSGADYIITECKEGIHVVLRYRVPPVGETALKDLGWFPKEGAWTTLLSTR